MSESIIRMRITVRMQGKCSGDTPVLTGTLNFGEKFCFCKKGYNQAEVTHHVILTKVKSESSRILTRGHRLLMLLARNVLNREAWTPNCARDSTCGERLKTFTNVRSILEIFQESHGSAKTLSFSRSLRQSNFSRNYLCSFVFNCVCGYVHMSHSTYVEVRDKLL